MNVDITTSVNNAATGAYNLNNSRSKSTSGEASSEAKTQKKDSADFGEAAVYEKSSEKPASAEGVVYETSKSDSTEKAVSEKDAKTEQRNAIIAQMKADLEERQNQLLEIVRKEMSGQGNTLAKADDIWKFLAEGNFTVDAATKAQAEKDIAEDGYWGVEQTSDRILDFAKNLAGNDPANADKMMDAFKKGYEEATKTWGKDLPELSKNTYEATLKKFEDWKNSANSVTAQDSTDSTTQQQTQATEANAAAQAAANVETV